MEYEPEKKTRKKRIDPNLQAAIDGLQEVIILLETNINDVGDHNV